MAQEEHLDTLQQMKKRIKDAASTMPAGRRVGVNDLTITMNDRSSGSKHEQPFPFMDLPGGEC